VNVAVRRLLLALLATGLMAGCGFQLQGRNELPPEMASTVIDTADPYTQFVRRLSILLEQNGASVIDGGPPTAILRLPEDTVRREVLSIGGTARIEEYRVVHRVRFQLVDEAGVELVPEQTIELNRVFSFDEQNILSATREEEFLREELADTMAREVLRRLGAGSP
jgi:LPS-assembly lipoprotein